MNENSGWFDMHLQILTHTHKCLQKMEIDHLPNRCHLLQVTTEEDETKWILTRVRIDSDTVATVALNQR